MLTDQEAGWCAKVHPAFRILCFLLFSLFLVTADPGRLVLAAVFLVFMYASTGYQSLVGMWIMLRRLRWFFLSIVIIYGWLTPGEPLMGMDLGGIMPSGEGLMDGGTRLLVLAMIVIAVHWLLWTTPNERLTVGIYWLTRPLGWIGLPRDRLALRIALTLSLVPRIQQQISETISGHGVRKRDIRAYAGVIYGIVLGVIEQAEGQKIRQIEIDIADAPPLTQWWLPVTLSLMMLAAGAMF